MSVAIHHKSEPDPGQGHVEVVSGMNQNGHAGAVHIVLNFP
jgi:hypothetical protein